MSTPNRAARKAAAIDNTAKKARTAAGKAASRPGGSAAGIGTSPVAKPTLGRSTGGKGGTGVYEKPRPVKPRIVKK